MRVRGPGRIIPARAGFTVPFCSGAFLAPDHPRSRGVYALIERLHLRLHRIIPARAGFTKANEWGGTNKWDHPRSRGVYMDQDGDDELYVGSSQGVGKVGGWLSDL